MTPFQWLSLTVLGLLILREALRLGRGLGSWQINVVRALVWAGAAATIADPNLAQAVAEVLKIGRAADLVLYVFVLTFLGTTFFFYARWQQTQQQITQLVRHIAIREARRDGTTGDAESSSIE